MEWRRSPQDRQPHTEAEFEAWFGGVLGKDWRKIWDESPRVPPPAASGDGGRRTSRRARKNRRLNHTVAAEDQAFDSRAFRAMLDKKTFEEAAPVREVDGAAVTAAWLRENFSAPFIVRSAEGLGLSVPPRSLRVTDVVRIVGPSTPVKVIEVGSQRQLSDWTLEEWGEVRAGIPLPP